METKINWDKLQEINRRVCWGIDEEITWLREGEHFDEEKLQKVVLAEIFSVSVNNDKLLVPCRYSTPAQFLRTVLLLRRIGISGEKCKELFGEELPSDKNIVRALSGLIPKNRKWRAPRKWVLDFPAGRSISKLEEVRE
jgi:hypothetical protein